MIYGKITDWFKKMIDGRVIDSINAHQITNPHWIRYAPTVSVSGTVAGSYQIANQTLNYFFLNKKVILLNLFTQVTSCSGGKVESIDFTLPVPYDPNVILAISGYRADNYNNVLAFGKSGNANIVTAYVGLITGSSSGATTASAFYSGFYGIQ